MIPNPNNWFPHFSPSGKICSGAGEVWAEGKNYGIGWYARWIDDDKFVCNTDIEHAIINTITGERETKPPACNITAAGGGHYALWLATEPTQLYYDGNLLVTGVAQPNISRVGDLVYPTQYHSNEHALVFNNGIIIPPTFGVVEPRTEAGVIVWSQYTEQNSFTRATKGWQKNTGVVDLTVLNPMQWPELQSIPIPTPKGFFVYTATHFGFFIRLWGEKKGWIHQGELYNPDAICIHDTIYLTGSTSGGGPILMQININSEMIDIPSNIPGNKIPKISKPCWMGWFEFTEPQNPAPHNCLIRFRTQPEGTIKNRQGKQFAQWAQGNTVDEIEQQITHNEYPTVAYWDARNWPRWPNLSSEDWLAFQAYCKNNETPQVFEQRMREILDISPNVKTALICQCYTSNLTLTSDLAGLVPVYARLARDYSKVNMLLIFSDQGRATGLNDHPEVRPLYQQLFDGITEAPNMTDIKIPQKAKDNINALYELHKDLSQGTDDQRRELMKLICEQNRYDLGTKHGWKSADPNRPPSKDAIAYSETNDNNSDVYIADVFDGTTRKPSIPENYELTNPRQHFISMNPVNHLQSNEKVNVIIQYHDTFVRRSDPNGMLIRFDCGPNPITEIELDLEGDGEPSIIIKFLDEPRRDGRYCRALAFKPTVNGTWVLRVKAKDNRGNIGQSDGSHRVTVDF